MPMSELKSETTPVTPRKRGRPRIGLGAQVICVSVEQSLLMEADRLAQALHLSRAALISKGLRHMLDVHASNNAPAARLSADTSAIVKMMDGQSLSAQRDRIEAEILAYVIVSASRGTLGETLAKMQAADFGAECFRNPQHRQVYSAAMKQALENGPLDDASILENIPEVDRDSAGVVLCAIAAFDVVPTASFERYLEQIRMLEDHAANS